MSSAIQIHLSDKKLPIEFLDKLIKQKLTGKGCVLHFALVIDPQELFISTIFPADVQISNQSSPGEYFEGLWEDTALEIFIGSSNSETYIELNLAPHGGWWAQSFKGYRERSSSVRPKVRSLLQFTPQSWLSTFAISKKDLNLPQFNNLTINVTAAVSLKEKELLSFTLLPPGKADFHLKELRTKASFPVIQL